VRAARPRTPDDVDAGRVPVLAPEGFVAETVAENVSAGTAMSRRAGYMYGLSLVGVGPAVLDTLHQAALPEVLLVYRASRWASRWRSLNSRAKTRDCPRIASSWLRHSRT
jgi:hypothetical protein